MVKSIKLILALCVSVALLAAMSLTVLANEDIEMGEPKDGIYADFSPKNAGGTWDGEVAREAAPDDKGLIMKTDQAGNVWGFYAKNVKAGVYKVGYYITLESVDGDNDDRVLRFKPFGEDAYLNYTKAELKPHEGKKILVVSLFKLNEDRETVEVGLWKGRGWEATLDKLVIATSDYNFANDPDYELIIERGPHDKGGSYVEPGEDEWVVSEKTEEPKTEEPKPTSDASVMIPLLVAGAAAFGALKLRRR